MSQPPHAQPDASASAPMPDKDQRLQFILALRALLRQDTDQARRQMAGALLLDAVADAYDDPEDPFFGGIAVEFGLPNVGQAPVLPTDAEMTEAVWALHAGEPDAVAVVADAMAQAGAQATCGRDVQHGPHTSGVEHCDGLLRRRKPGRLGEP